MRPLRLALVCLATLSTAASWGAPPRDPAVLKGLGRQLCVAVDDLGVEARQSGLTAEELKASVVGELGKAGFEVKAGSAACLRLSVRTHALPAAGLVSHYVELALVEEVAPVRASLPRIPAPTWAHGTVGTSLSARVAAAALTTAASAVGIFADEYQLVNPAP